MKKITLSLLMLIPFLSFGQDDVYGPATETFADKQTALRKELNKGGYKTQIGWHLKVGDTLSFGRGTLPNHYFAFAYDSPVSWSNIMGGSNNSYDNKSSSIDGYNKRYVTSDFRNRAVTIKKFQLIGNKKIGLKTIAVVGVGSTTNYWIEIDNAIEDGEIKVPVEFQSKVKNGESGQTPISTADELKKYKELLDSGGITQDEYDKIKKKLLGL